MKLVAQIAAGVTLAILVVWFWAASSVDSDNRGSPVTSAISNNHSAAPVATLPSSPPYAIVLCAAGLNGHCYNSTPMGPTFDSIQSCLAALPAFANGHAASKDGRAYITNTTWYECIGQPTETPVQPDADTGPRDSARTAPEPKSYTIATCFKNEAIAKAAAGPGGWQPGDAPCIQMQPVVHEDGLGCLIALAKLAKSSGQLDLVRVGNEAHFFMRGKPHDMWIQCYNTGQPP
jgi:hypothetical protein